MSQRRCRPPPQARSRTGPLGMRGAKRTTQGDGPPAPGSSCDMMLVPSGRLAHMLGGGFGQPRVRQNGMIVYDVKCKNGHVFTAWFRNSDSFDQQAAAGEI